MNPNQSSGQTALSGPLSLFGSAWALFKTNWKLFVSISAVPAAGMIISDLLTLFPGVIFKILGGIMALVSGIAMVFMQIALVDALRRVSDPSLPPMTAVQFYKAAPRLFWAYVLVAFMQGLIMLGATMLFFIPGLIVIVYTCVYTLALLVDEKRNWEAFVESYRLTRGRWLAVCGRAAFIMAASVAGYLIISGLHFLIVFATPIPAKSAAAQGLANILSSAGGIVIIPFSVMYLYLFYVSLKATRPQIPEASAGTFKRWLVAFLVIGALTAVAALVIVPTAAFFMAVGH